MMTTYGAGDGKRLTGRRKITDGGLKGKQATSTGKNKKAVRAQGNNDSKEDMRIADVAKTGKVDCNLLRAVETTRPSEPAKVDPDLLKALEQIVQMSRVLKSSGPYVQSWPEPFPRPGNDISGPESEEEHAVVIDEQVGQLRQHGKKDQKAIVAEQAELELADKE